ncbi:hypothetical protein AB0P21_37605 [Kribbella sp. NPDC056861]|uniref:hypothetical protein n=1 Tax=Kribbella sp. NPDC056861 TaxID=3154857 RepID=UPI003445D748
MGAYTKYEGGSSDFALVSGVVSGLGILLVVILIVRRQDFATQAALGDLPAAVRRGAYQAQRRSRPVPTDPEVRSAAIRLAEYRLVQLLRWRNVVVVGWGLWLAFSVFTLIRQPSLWRLGLVVLYLFLIGQQFYLTRSLRNRVEVLKAESEGD